MLCRVRSLSGLTHTAYPGEVLNPVRLKAHPTVVLSVRLQLPVQWQFAAADLRLENPEFDFQIHLNLQVLMHT